MFGDNFYPTPESLADRMLSCIRWDGISNVLEPSAGRGDLIERIVSKLPYHTRDTAIDAIEIDPELAQVLDGKGFRPIASDFLAFQSFRQYDVVVMNPPFSNGDMHLLRALELVRDGGQVVCLLNAETIRKPYTRTRQQLAEKLEAVGASIEYVKDGFKDAARQTDVEVALVVARVDKKPTSSIVANLMEAEQIEAKDSAESSSDLVDGDFAAGAVRRFNVEVKAGLKLIDEYLALKPILTRSFNQDYPGEILELTVNGNKYGSPHNTLVETLRMKYWQELFHSREFSRMFTSATAKKYEEQIGNLARYEFNIANIKQMQIELSQSMLGTLDDAIIRLFDGFVNQYWDESSNNVHYYNGWKTNKAYVVNKRVIDRCCGLFDSWDGKMRTYNLHESIVSDIGKVFAYLDGKVFDADDLARSIRMAEYAGAGKWVEFPYCKAKFYKKGTVHIEFEDDKLLKKFNLIGSRGKGWLPSNYGKSSYEDMTTEERDVVDAVEGSESYADTVAEYGFYLEPRTTLPVMIGEGEAA